MDDKPIDVKRKELRQYLQNGGVMDALTKVLVYLYEPTDKPEDAVEFLRKALGDTRPTNTNVQQLRDSLDNAAQELQNVRAENDNLRARLAAKDPDSELLKSHEEDTPADAEAPAAEGEGEAPAEEAVAEAMVEAGEIAEAAARELIK